MKNKLLIIIIIILAFIYFTSFPKKETFFNNDSNAFFIKLKMSNEEIKTLKLEDYVLGVVAAEMPASFDNEALKAQSIVSRTYAMYKYQKSVKDYTVVTSVSDQAYIDEEQMKKKWSNNFSFYYNKLKSLVKETEGLVIKSNNEIVCSFYYSMSNGFTENSESVFGEKLDYIQSVESIWDKENKNYEVTTNFNITNFCKSLSIKCDKLEINSIKKSDTNHISNITINNKSFTGLEIRKLLNLRSTDFEITIEKDVVSVKTKGYGHGVGMSQYGANKMAQMGYNYEEIIKYYYKNITIEKLVV